MDIKDIVLQRKTFQNETIRDNKNKRIAIRVGYMPIDILINNLIAIQESNSNYSDIKVELCTITSFVGTRPETDEELEARYSNLGKKKKTKAELQAEKDLKELARLKALYENK